MRPQALEEVLKNLPTFKDPNILVGTSTSDDAGVYKISPDLALVQVYTNNYNVTNGRNTFKNNI